MYVIIVLGSHFGMGPIAITEYFFSCYVVNRDDDIFFFLHYVSIFFINLSEC